MHRSWKRPFAWLFLIALLIAGCGGGSNPQAVAAGADSVGSGGNSSNGSGGNTGGDNGQARAAPLPPTCEPAAAGSPANLIGPLESDPPGSASKNYPWVATELDLAANGYVEQEFFYCGFANSQGGSYTVRMIVRRPINPANASGKVFAEWINVTSLADLEIFWAHSFEHLMREGHTYVGLSVQRGGHYPAPRGTLHFSPDRYAQLHWPGGHAGGAHDFITDPAAHDIYTHGLQLLKSDSGPISDITIEHLIATGGSQSSVTLQVYYAQHHPAVRLADAFLLLIISSASAGDAPVSFVPPDFNTAVVGTPVLQINSETDTDVTGKPDSNTYVLWEVSGTSHYDHDECVHEEPLWIRDIGVEFKATYDANCALPALSRIPLKHTINAGMEHVIAWLENGTPPPSQPRFQYAPLGGQPERDADGNVLGGIQLPEFAVPIATNSRNNSGEGCFLAGSSVPFTAERLRELYPMQQDYLTAFDAAADAAVQAGVLLEPDAAASKAWARQQNVPPPLP